ncbi:hypothetical protein SmJEL517_g01955 [Synchytrium microbalum]|uniref:DUF1682-domain-containing protein n=1 Tax=Synchytrium microbalum TaxID=1806994 RepID=A0A507C991_9FUNG|nr:uncharacterized protein SmJEL517_g01955 [Synchytrium microbalum]TPX35739.1 hypothetical protein SmJEL517_g01955 [Synchytrium microbalum]
MKWTRILLFLAIIFVSISLVKGAAKDLDDEDDDEELQVKGDGKVPKAIPISSSGMGITWSNLNPLDFVGEAFVLVFFAGMFWLYRTGRATNNEIAKNWYRATGPVWEKNFAQVGNDKGHKLIRDGAKDFIFYATGRVNVEMIYAFVETSPRHDVMKNIAQYLPNNTFDTIGIKWTEDKLVMRAYLDETASDDFILAILPKKTSATFIKSRYDLKTFTKELKEPAIKNFPFRHYTLASDCPEFAGILTQDGHLQKVLYAAMGLTDEGEGTAKSSLIESIIISDQPKTAPEKLNDLENTSKTITFTFKLPKGMEIKDQITKHQPTLIMMTECFIDIIDYVGQFGKLSNDVNARLERIREAATAELEKKKSKEVKEELDKKKFEELKKRKEAAEKAGPEALKRFEEKERKTTLKKQLKKRKKLIV